MNTGRMLKMKFTEKMGIHIVGEEQKGINKIRKPKRALAKCITTP